MKFEQIQEIIQENLVKQEEKIMLEANVKDVLEQTEDVVMEVGNKEVVAAEQEEVDCTEPNVETEMVQQESLEAVSEGAVEESAPEPEITEDVQAAEAVLEPESYVVESAEVAVDTPESMSVLNTKLSKEDLRAMLESIYMGVKFLSPSEVRLAEDDGESTYLIISLKKNKTSGGRVYHLDEMVDGEAQCQNNPKADFDPSVIKNGGTVLENFIIDRQGDYLKNINDVLSIIQCIENNRLLTVDKEKCINHAVLTAEEFKRRIKEFLKNNPFDEKIAYIEGDKTNLIGVVGRGNYTAYQNFKRLVNELAPENDVKRLKDNLYAKGFFITDSNDTCKDAQKTLSIDMRKDKNIRGDKMYAFNLEKSFMEEFKLIYDKHCGTQDNNNKKTTHDKKES